MGSYSKHETVERKRIEKVAKSVPTRLVGILMCICRAITKFLRRDISKLRNLAGHLCYDWNGHSERCSTDGIAIKARELLVPLYPYSLLCVGIYKSSFTSGKFCAWKACRRILWEHWVVKRIETGASKEVFVSKVPGGVVLKARLR